MPAPLLFIGLPVLLAPVAYLARRHPRIMAVVSVLVMALLTALAQTLPLDTPITWAGGLVIPSTLTVISRAFVVETGDRSALAFIFAQTAVLVALGGISRIGRFFLPTALVAVSLAAAALLVQPFLFAALFIEISAALAAFILVETERGLAVAPSAGRGALRFLVFTTLSLPFILLGGGRLENNLLAPQGEAALLQAALLLGVGFAILLAVVPFHSWLPAIAESAPPLATTFVVTIMRVTGIFLLLNFLDTYVWLHQNPAVYRVLTLAGGGMVGVGALFAFGQRNFGRVMGYALLIDFGAILLAIGLNTPAGVQAALSTLALRGLALPLWAVGLERLRLAAGGQDEFEALQGLAWKYPGATFAVMAGLLSLVGFPLTAGFPGRWALLALLAQIHPTAAGLLLLGMVSVGLVCARGLMSLVTRPANEERPAQLWSDVREHPTVFMGFTLGVLVVVMLGFFPQWLLEAVAQAAAAFPNLMR